MTVQTIRILSARVLKQCCSMARAIDIMRETFVQLSCGQATVPERLHLGIPEYQGDLLVKPAYLPSAKRLGVKFISLYEDNPARGLPMIQGMVLLMDAADGRPLALLDGAYITALRTGAASGAATEALARAEARVVVIFGAGAQAKTQLEAVCAVRQIERAIIFGRSRRNAVLFAEKMRRQLSIPVEPANSTAVLTEADIICTATSASEALFADTDLKPGVHINAIGSYNPRRREIPGETVRRARVVVDRRESCWREAGDLIIPLRAGLIDQNQVHAELGEILAGTKPGRKSAEEVTLFKSVGNAAQDIATAVEAFDTARKRNLGIEVSI